MRVLFIIAPDKKPKTSFFKLRRKTGLYIPLSVAQIAAVLERQKHQVKALDLRLCDSDIIKETVRAVKEFKPGIVGFTTSFFSSSIVNELSVEIRRFSDAKILLGGPYATVFAGELLRENKAIDIVVMDEGDYTIGEIIEAIEKSKGLEKIKGITYRDGANIIKTEERPVIDDLDVLPTPAFHLFDFKRYVPLPKHYKKTPMLPMMTGRGCVYGKCTFCYQPRRYGRRQSPEKVVSQIEYFKRIYDIKEVRFWDDIFLYDKRWINRFCDLLEKKKLGLIWSCHARVDMVTKEVLMRAAKAGCWQILYGIESVNLDLLNSIKKGTTVQQAINAVNWTKQARIEVRISCMLGLPEETPQMTDETIRFAYELNADITQFSLATPYPGTIMYEMYKNSKKIDKDIKKYSELVPIFLPKGYKTKKLLEDKFRGAYRNHYFKPRYLLKKIAGIRSWDDIRRNYDGITMALGMSY